MAFKELAHIFSDEDNQRMSREVLNRVSSYSVYCEYEQSCYFRNVFF